MEQKPKLLEQVRAVARARHLSHKTEDVYHNFIKRFILFHNKQHPKEMGAEEITAFFDAFGGQGECFRFDAKSGVVCLAVSLSRCFKD